RRRLRWGGRAGPPQALRAGPGVAGLTPPPRPGGGRSAPAARRRVSPARQSESRPAASGGPARSVHGFPLRPSPRDSFPLLYSPGGRAFIQNSRPMSEEEVRSQRSEDRKSRSSDL